MIDCINIRHIFLKCNFLIQKIGFDWMISQNTNWLMLIRVWIHSWYPMNIFAFINYLCICLQTKTCMSTIKLYWCLSNKIIELFHSTLPTQAALIHIFRLSSSIFPYHSSFCLSDCRWKLHEQTTYSKSHLCQFMNPQKYSSIILSKTISKTILLNPQLLQHLMICLLQI